MAEINSAEDYQKLLDKYTDRLKLARRKYDEFKLELAMVDRSLSVAVPDGATEAQRNDYASMIKARRKRLQSLDDLCKDFDDRFDAWARTLKRYG